MCVREREREGLEIEYVFEVSQDSRLIRSTILTEARLLFSPRLVFHSKCRKRVGADLASDHHHADAIAGHGGNFHRSQVIQEEGDRVDGGMHDLSKGQVRPKEAKACRSPGDQASNGQLHDLDRLAPRLCKVTINLHSNLGSHTLTPLSLFNCSLDLHVRYMLSYNTLIYAL